MQRLLIPVILFFIISCSTDNRDSDMSGNRSVFQKIDNSESGIHFANSIQENVETKENIFDYDFFYIGAGVGIADIILIKGDCVGCTIIDTRY